jgi:hypothetical protein
MRKIAAVLICLMMIVPLFSVGTSAVQGTAINSAADFASMAADGKYYLNADIKIDTTYVTPFKGVFDGNGHTVTVSVPMFAEFNGTVKNLTINGTELKGNQDLAPFAIFSYDGMTAINVVNNVDVTVTGLSSDKTSGLNAGGILAKGDAAATCVFRSCINNGNITVQTVDVTDTTKGTQYETHAGGLAGCVDGFEAKYCVNNGMISAPSNSGRAGGIVGFAVFMATLCNCNIIDCTNTAEIYGGYHAGGMAGTIGVASNSTYVPYTLKYCVNTGAISGGYMVGGLVGYCYASAASMTMYIEITSCVSIANVKAGQPATNLAGSAQYAFASLLIGYTNSVYNKIEDCLAVGELGALTGDNYVAPFRCIHGCSSAKTADEQHTNNYIYDNNTIEWYTYATSDSNAAQRIPIADAISTGKFTYCTLTELQNGTILEKLNAAAETPVFSQKIGTDPYPTIDLTLRAQREAADVLDAETTAETTTSKPVETTTTAKVTTSKPIETTVPVETSSKPADTTAAVTTSDTTTAKKGGCGSVFVSGVAIVAILGGAVVIGKKRKV